MRDRSSVDFEEGQWVRVVDDVVSGKTSMHEHTRFCKDATDSLWTMQAT
jgi:orotate phosphoribosyltransferase